MPRPALIQPPISLLRREALTDLLPLCVRERIGVAPYQVLQGGLLTGKYRRGATVPPDSRKAEKDSWVWPLNDELFDRLEAIDAEARDRGMSMTRWAIRWVLEQPAVVSVLVGVKHEAQIDEAVDAAGGDS